MNIAIIGGRDFDNYELLKQTLLSAPELNFNTNGTVYSVVSGGAKGTDSLAERFAEEYGLNIIVFPADWKRYGRGAGIIRNKEIISKSDIVFAFWDGKSKGTKSSIDLAKKQNKQLTIIYYGEETELE